MSVKNSIMNFSLLLMDKPSNLLVILVNSFALKIVHINGKGLHGSSLFLKLLFLLVVKDVQIFHLVLKRVHKVMDVCLFLLIRDRSLLLEVRNDNVEGMRL